MKVKRWVWKYSVNGWGDTLAQATPENFAPTRDQLVNLLRQSRWYQDQGADDDERHKSGLGKAIQDLQDAATPDDMDQALWGIYNWSDAQRAWLTPPGADPVPDIEKTYEGEG